MEDPVQNHPPLADNDPPLADNGYEEESSSFEDLGDDHNSSLPQEVQRDATGSSPKKVLDARINYSQIKMHILTWNIASAEPSTHDIESLFVPQESCLIANILEDVDMLVIGLQEAYPTVQGAVQASVPFVGKDPLIEQFSQVLSDKGFARLCGCRLLGIVTMVFVKRPVLCYVHNVETCTTKTGVGGLLGNKGASTIRFSLCDMDLCFVNCHLVPHTENNARRLEELQGIFNEQTFSKSPYDLEDHDLLVVFGDLNFRLEGQEMEEVVKKVRQGKWQQLLQHDQLRLEQASGMDLLSKLDLFMEMSISFPPSYKYVVGSDHFDEGPKRRAPAWCDRILWHTHQRRLPQVTDPDPRPLLLYHYYHFHLQPRISDHKAVCGGFSINVDLDQHVPLVVFNVMQEWQAKKAGVIAFEMAIGTNISMWDWVGLYPVNFSSIDKDYIFWVYTPAKSRELVKGREFVRSLQPEQVPEAGCYRLLYKSHSYDKVIGMSPIFRIQ